MKTKDLSAIAKRLRSVGLPWRVISWVLYGKYGTQAFHTVARQSRPKVTGTITIVTMDSAGNGMTWVTDMIDSVDYHTAQASQSHLSEFGSLPSQVEVAEILDQNGLEVEFVE